MTTIVVIEDDYGNAIYKPEEATRNLLLKEIEGDKLGRLEVVGTIYNDRIWKLNTFHENLCKKIGLPYNLNYNMRDLNLEYIYNRTLFAFKEYNRNPDNKHFEKPIWMSFIDDIKFMHKAVGSRILRYVERENNNMWVDKLLAETPYKEIRDTIPSKLSVSDFEYLMIECYIPGIERYPKECMEFIEEELEHKRWVEHRKKTERWLFDPLELAYKEGNIIPYYEEACNHNNEGRVWQIINFMKDKEVDEQFILTVKSFSESNKKIYDELRRNGYNVYDDYDFSQGKETKESLSHMNINLDKALEDFVKEGGYSDEPDNQVCGAFDRAFCAGEMGRMIEICEFILSVKEKMKNKSYNIEERNKIPNLIRSFLILIKKLRARHRDVPEACIIFSQLESYFGDRWEDIDPKPE